MWEEVALNFDEMLKYWQEMLIEVEHRLAMDDHQMAEEHACRTNLAVQNVHYMFS